jgi:uncharacterized protein with FMN-binding domain
MRRIVTAILSTITALVLIFGYHTSSNNTAAAASPVVQQPASPPSSTPPASSRSKSGSSTHRSSRASRTAAPTPAATYTGGVASTQWGPVQVQITVQGHKITRARAVQYPQGTSTDAQINGYALPILDKEVIQQQRAAIDTVSGATVTSDGYLQSLQSAIDTAHL